MTRDRIDRLLAALTGLAMLGSLVVTTRIAFPSYSLALRQLAHPLSLEQWQALWTGLLSADLMLLQTVCLARLPWLERVWGRGVLMALHRIAGWWSFWLMIVHVVLFVLQRSLRRPTDLSQAMLGLFVTDRWMLWASIGTVLLILVVVTSTARVRRWLRYEHWHLLHLWAYAGLALTLPHMLVSADFTAGWVRVWWWTLYLVVLALVLGFRVALPILRSTRARLHVVEVTPDPSGAVSVVVGGRGLSRWRTRSGQFFVWRFLGARGRTRGHPFSLSAAPTPHRLRITVADRAAERAARLDVGQRVLIEGPFGVPGLHRRHPRLLLMAAGVGITPFRALLEDLPFEPGEVTLVHRVRSDPGPLARELEGLSGLRGFELIVLAGPRRAAYSWLPEGTEGGEGEVLLDLVPDVGGRDVRLCGPDGWADAVQRAARSVDVARRDVRRERFTW